MGLQSQGVENHLSVVVDDGVRTRDLLTGCEVVLDVAIVDHRGEDHSRLVYVVALVSFEVVVSYYSFLLPSIVCPWTLRSLLSVNPGRAFAEH